MKCFLSLTVVLVIIALAATALATGPYRAHPEKFNPGGAAVTIVAEWKPGTGREATPDAGKSNHGLTLEISALVPFPPGASADATVTPVEGDTLTSVGFDHKLGTHCTGGSPRWIFEATNGGG